LPPVVVVVGSPVVVEASPLELGPTVELPVPVVPVVPVIAVFSVVPSVLPPPLELSVAAVLEALALVVIVVIVALAELVVIVALAELVALAPSVPTLEVESSPQETTSAPTETRRPALKISPIIDAQASFGSADTD